MELSEAKKECKDLIEEYLSCSVIGLDMQVDVGFGEKRCEAIDTVLKELEDSISKKQHDMIVKSMNSIIDSLQEKLDNSISKDDIRKKMEELEKIRDEFLSERKGCIFNTEKINCCTFARNILFDLIEE